MARNPSLPTNIIPPFRSRRTLADCVAENMKLAGRLSHWHRLAAVCALSDTSTQLSTDVKQSFKTMLSNVNLKSRGSDKISGFVAFSAAHAVMVLTGNERNFGVFFGELSKRWAGFFANSRVVFYQTNVNYVSVFSIVLFRKCVFPIIIVYNIKALFRTPSISRL